MKGQYQLQIGEPYWMPEIGLGLGRSQQVVGGVEREMLSWFIQGGDRYLSAAEQAAQAQAEAHQAQLEAQAERQSRLDAIAQLHQMGLSVTQISAALGVSVDVVNAQLS